METLETYFQKADNYRHQQQWDEAIKCYLTVLEMKPEDWQARHYLGDCLIGLKRWQEAAEEYCQALAINPQFSWAYHNLGIVLVNLEQFEEAYKCFVRIDEQEPHFWDSQPGNFQIQQRLGDYLLEQECWEYLVVVCRRVIRLNPNFEWGHINLKRALEKLGKSEETFAVLQKADDYRHQKQWDELEEFESTEQVQTNNLKATVFLFPDYRITNPYQRMLYTKIPDGWYVQAGNIDLALQTIESQENQGKVVFHLHWTSPILARSETLEEAVRKKNQFLKKIFDFLLKGGAFIWTIHNVMPHYSDYPDVELELRKVICTLASKIHIHSEKSIPEIEVAFPLPRHKLEIVHHGNYLNCYPNYVSREQARKRFHFNDSDLVFLFLGQIRPYKGIDELFSAFIEVKKRFNRAYLLIAGNPIHPFKKGFLAGKVKVISNVIVEEKLIPDAELQWFFNAADVVVLPYRKILTSGSVLNALSFSRPVIAPRVGMIEEVITEGENGFLYEIGNVNSLTAAMSRASRAVQVLPEQRDKLFSQALESIQKYTWDNAGKKLLNELKYSVQTIEIAIETEAVKCKVWNPRENVAKAGHIAILILNYNLTEDTIKLVESLEKSSKQNFDIVIIDNDSKNISFKDLVEKFSNYTIIRSPVNLGYAGGNNLGIKYAFEHKFDFIWILNPDTHVQQDTLKYLIEGAQLRPDISIYGSTICWSHEPEKVWFAGGAIEKTESQLKTYHLYDAQNKSLIPSEIYEVDYVTGASIFCRREIFEDVGLIPERYFLYFEETDWCLRAKEKGHLCGVVPSSVLYHAKRSQPGVLPTKTYFYYFIRGSVLFMLKYFSQNHSIVEMSIRNNFITPWIQKIKTRSPKQFAYFSALGQQAIRDGLNGVIGVVNLQQVFTKAEDRNIEKENPVVGNLEIDEEKISGWFYNKTQFLERFNVKINIDGKTQISVLAQEYIEELKQQGFGDGNYGFEIKTPSKLFDGKSHTVEVLAGASKLSEIVQFPERSPAYKGRIDGISENRMLNGWVLDLNHQEVPIKVEILDGTKVIAATPWNQIRPDLVKAGFETENAGFSCPIPIAYCDGRKHKLSLRIAETQEVIYERAVMMSIEKYPKANVYSIEELWQWLYSYREVSMVHQENRDLPYLKQIENWAIHLAKKFASREQNHLVSIIMPVYNRAAIIRVAMESVINQSYHNWELIITDDGSSDDTVAIVQEFIKEYPERCIFLFYSF